MSMVRRMGTVLNVIELKETEEEKEEERERERERIIITKGRMIAD